MQKNMQSVDNVYQQFAGDIFRYAMFKLRNKEQAEDVTSETFMRVLKGRDVQEIENLKGWIFTIAHNVVVDKYKQPMHSDVSEIDEENNMAMMDDTKSVENMVVDNELLEIVKQHLDKLSDVEREIVILKVWEEMTFGEITNVVQLPESNVKLKYYRALEKLKLSLGEEGGKKTYTIGIPLIAAAITKMAILPEYQISSALLGNIAAGNLVVSSKLMSSILLKLKMLPVWAKAAAVTVPTVGVVATGTAIVISTQPTQPVDNPPAIVEPTVPEDKLPTDPDQPGKLQDYKNRFDVVVLEAGELKLWNKGRTDAVTLTDTGGRVKDFRINGDYTKIYYTVTDESIITPKAELAESRLEAVYPQSGVSYANMLDRKLATKLYELDVDTGEERLLVDYADFDIEAQLEGLSFEQLYRGGPSSPWKDNSLELAGLDKAGKYVFINRRGLYMINIADGTSVFVRKVFNAPSRSSGHNPVISMANLFGDVRFDGHTLTMMITGWEAGGTAVYTYQSGAFTEITFPGHEFFCNDSFCEKVIGIDDSGDIVTFAITYGQESLTAQVLYILDPQSGLEKKKIDLLAQGISWNVGIGRPWAQDGKVYYWGDRADYLPSGPFNPISPELGKLIAVNYDSTVSTVADVSQIRVDGQFKIVTSEKKGNTLYVQTSKYTGSGDTRSNSYAFYVYDIGTNSTTKFYEQQGTKEESANIKVALFGK